ncbi:hypothetical protein FRB99_006561, partial [Tulasnella sp. 403]
MTLPKVEAAVDAVVHGKNPVSAVKDASWKNFKIPPIDIPVPTAADLASAPKTPADEAIDFFGNAPAPGDAPIQVYELKLEEDGGPNKDRAYTRLPPPYRPYILRVTLDAGTPPCNNGIFKTNFPLDGGKFDRAKFVERTLPSVFSKPIQIDLPVSHAGAFVYWIEYDAPGGSPERVKGREGYFNVDPVLRIKKRQPILSDDNKVLSPTAGGGSITSDYIKIPLDGLSVLTAVSKWMGTLPEWLPHLREASEKGYNMIHYTPLQQRGSSRSPYSIADQLAFDSELFEDGCSRETGVHRVAEALKAARDQYGLLSLIDVVLNHTANNSAWLVEHPEAGYTLSEAWGRVLDVLNVDLYKEWEEDSRVALDNIRNRLKYTRLDEHGPRLGKITRDLPLVDTYFTRLPPSDDYPRSALCLANNGWIWDADPLKNFALRPSKAYLRREVIAWGDCVKLRYGDGPSSNPWLWEYMTKYVETLAYMFDGFRIDNCHSTPLHVGVFLLDKARVINPNLYVAAELFTGSEETDLVFVSRLGINSLIREAYNGWDPKELSRLLYRYGLGKPVGSMDGACLTYPEDIPSPFAQGPSRPGIVTPLQGSAPHALLFDLTHDNESPLSKRSAEDALSTGALATFGWCAVGSVKGLDELFPKLLDLVGDNRKYEVSETGDYKGIGEVKRLLNHLHSEMVLDGYSEGHVHQENNYIVLSRVQPTTQKGYLLVAHTAFSKGSKDRGWIDPIKLRRTKAEFIYGTTVDIPSYDLPVDTTTIRGLPATLGRISSFDIRQGSDEEGPYTEIIVPDYFPPGSILVFATQMQDIDPTLDDFCKSQVTEAFNDLDLVDLNVLLHRCDGEEKDATGGEIGTYNIPGIGNLVYCGLEGWIHPLRHIMKFNDLGHPLCGHLREGTWAMDYVSSRLERQVGTFPRLAKPAAWFKERFEKIKATVPSFLRPKYFAIVISEAYKAARRATVEQCSDFVSNGHVFTQDLALCSIQMYGLVQSASLDPAKPVPCLAAGLPHFAAGWARTWGRDMAPDGITILAEPVKRRFPLDDAFVAWDDPIAYSYSSTVAEIIQEILQRHALGINFREHNAGPNLDMQMSDEGFNINIRVDWETGIIYGGNAKNCGTWMDKMGESQRAGTKGVPGTPRDGAPVEIIGLLKSTLRWLDELSSVGVFPFKGVEAEIDGKLRVVTYKEWSDLLQASFEKHFYVPLDPAEDSKYAINPAVVNRRGIYKDVYGTPKDREWSDYQLRCNFPIAMTVAPELFDPAHALGALKIADEALRSPLGMKTLDANDAQYRGDYDNSNDSDDPSVAKGRNYHNGPEWGWPLGYFLRAYLHFALVQSGGKDLHDILHHLHTALLVSRRHIQNDPWAGLPELTNRNGAYCHDSCRTQAWSASTLLDFLDDVYRL